MKYDYSLIVIGGGAAGLSAAKTASGFGKKTLMVEQDRLGGECTWYGCVPSKALIRAAHAVWESRTLDRYQGGVSPDPGSTQRPMPDHWSSIKTLDYVRSVQERIYLHENPEAVESWGVEVLKGQARITGPHEVEVADKVLTAKSIVIATGSENFIPPIPGLDQIDYLTNQNLFSLDRWPKSLMVMGAGPIGVEMAQSFNRLGTEVTLVEMAPRILPREDEELALKLQQQLEREGVRVHCGAKVGEFSKDENGVRASYEKAGVREAVTAERVLVSIGRRARVEGLGLKELGVRFGVRGIEVDKRMRTSIKSIYAVGDCTGIYPLSHSANLQGVTAGLDHSLPIAQKADYTHMLWTVFSDPEFARMGMTEEEARQRYGDKIQVVRYDITGLDRARCDGVQVAMAKWILRGGRIIGAHILAPRAGELIHQSQVMRVLGKKFTSQSAIIHAYPTYSELHKNAARATRIADVLNHPIVKILRRLRGSKG